MEAKLLQTKAGKGYKIVVNGIWYYTSAGEFAKFLSGKSAAVNFRTIAAVEAAQAAPASAAEEAYWESKHSPDDPFAWP